MRHAGFKEMLKAALEGVETQSSAGTPRVVAPRETICDELRAFGEDQIAEQVARLPANALTRIFDVAGEIEVAGLSRSPGQSLCMAAVVVIEGRSRPLARQRRRRAPKQVVKSRAVSPRGERMRGGERRR